MKLRATTSQLKARLAHYLRAVRRGDEVTVMSRDVAIAKVVALSAEPPIDTSPKEKPLGSLTVRGIKPRDTDTLAMLLEDRKR